MQCKSCTLKEDKTGTMQKYPSCPGCGKRFNTTDIGNVKTCNTRSLPFLLLCGHTVCGGCVKKISQTSAVSCPVCQLPHSLGDDNVQNLITDVYVLGLCEFRRKQTMDGFQSKVVYYQSDMNHVKTSKKKKQPQIVCVECGIKTASCKCDRCDCCLCSTCFDKVHKSSKILMSHRALPLDAEEAGVRVMCSVHEDQAVELYCMDDETTICSKCASVGDHKGHRVTSFVNLIRKSRTVLRHMKQSEKVINSTILSVKTECQHVADDISQHFRRIHGLLQIREAALTQQVFMTLMQVEQQKLELQTNILNLDRAIKAAPHDFLLKKHDEDTKQALDMLHKSLNLPCLAENVKQQESSSVIFQSSDDLADIINDYGKVNRTPEAVIRQQLYGITFKSLAEIPEDLESGKVCQEGDESFSRIQEPTEKKKKTKSLKLKIANAEMVYVTHIKNPHHFLVQRCSDLHQINQLQKRINAYCRNPNTTRNIPEKPAVGDYVLSEYMGTWYRAQIIKILTDTSIPDLTQLQLEVVYIDYGNTAVVTLDSLRVMKQQFMKKPAYTQVCCLMNIVPANESGEWSTEAIHAFAMMTEDRPIQMLVKDQKNDVLYVDLGKPECDDVKDSQPESVRDALIFLEYGCFFPLSGVSHSEEGIPLPRTQYIQPRLPCKGSSVQCVVSFTESPQKFFVQQVDKNYNLLHEMMSRIQAIYTQDTKNLYTIFCPQKDKVCAALYDEDNMWYRAQVVEVPSRHHVKVRYVDYGNEEYVSQWNLRELLDEFVSLPVQAVECQLADVVPLSEETGWTSEAIQLFQEETDSKRMEITVKNVINDKVLDVILKQLHESNSLPPVGSICYNSWLVQRDLAVSTGPCSVPASSTASDEDSYLDANPEMVQLGLVSLSDTEAGSDDPVPDRPLGDEVRISHIVNAGEMYLHLESSAEDRRRLISNLTRHYTTSKPVVKEDAKAGELCAVLHPENKLWYRGEILSVTDGKAKMQLIDFGNVITLTVSDVYQLPGQFSDQKRYALRCHLKGLKPAGDSTRWTKTSTEYLSSLLGGEFCYLDQQITKEGESLGVDLIKKEIIKGDALTGDQVLYQSVRELILNKGLALPQNLPIRRCPTSRKQASSGISHIGKPSATSQTMAPSSEKQIKKSTCYSQASSALHNSDDSDDEDVDDDGETEGSVVSIPSAATPVSDIASPQPVSQPVDKPVCMPYSESVDYKLPPIPTETTESVVPTFVDYDCHIYVQTVKPDDHPEGRLGFMLKENTIEVQLQDAYCKKMNLYRAKIIRDGNCLFRAFALALFSDQDRYPEVRKTVVDRLQHYWWLFENILPGATKTEYIETISKDGSYGGEPEISAVSSTYQVRVDLYMGGLNTPIVCRTYGNTNDPLVRLSYVHNGQYDLGHYDLLVDDKVTADKAEVVYSKWRAQRVEEYQMSERKLNSNRYDNSILDQIMAYLQTKYQNSPSEPATVWEVGQPVVAQYPDDGLFYRAKIISKQEYGYKVKYVDFGNDSVVSATMLRSTVELPDIPVHCYECILDNIQPPTEDDKWTTPVLDQIHAKVVGKSFIMYIKNNTEDQKLVIDLVDNTGRSLAYELCELGLAGIDEKKFDSDHEDTDCSSPIAESDVSVTAGQFIYGIPKRSVESPFPNHIQLNKNDIISCLVTQVDSPNEVYLQRTKQEDDDSEMIVEVNRELDNLLEVQAILNTEFNSYDKITEAKPGLACCAKYSWDECWYRGEILSVGHGADNSLCAVLLVDYGSLEYTEANSLLKLPPELIPFTVQAVKCHLSGIHCPAADATGDDNVCYKATKAMMDVLTSQPLIAVVKSCTDLYAVDLYDREKFSAVGLEASLVYADLIKSGLVIHNSEEESDAIVEEVYVEELDQSESSSAA